MTFIESLIRFIAIVTASLFTLGTIAVIVYILLNGRDKR